MAAMLVPCWSNFGTISKRCCHHVGHVSSLKAPSPRGLSPTPQARRNARERSAAHLWWCWACFQDAPEYSGLSKLKSAKTGPAHSAGHSLLNRTQPPLAGPFFGPLFGTLFFASWSRKKDPLSGSWALQEESQDRLQLSWRPKDSPKGAREGPKWSPKSIPD